MNSKDLYPLNRNQLAARLGYTSWQGLHARGVLNEIPHDRVTYIGREQCFTLDVVETLIAKGYVAKRKRKAGTMFLLRKRVFNTPMGTVELENDVPLPEREEKPAYPFEHMLIGQSFVLPAKSKKTLEHAVTDANRQLSPKKFTRRYFEQAGEVRIWRIA